MPLDIVSRGPRCRLDVRASRRSRGGRQKTVIADRAHCVLRTRKWRALVAQINHRRKVENFSTPAVSHPKKTDKPAFPADKRDTSRAWTVSIVADVSVVPASFTPERPQNRIRTGDALNVMDEITQTFDKRAFYKWESSQYGPTPKLTIGPHWILPDSPVFNCEKDPPRRCSLFVPSMTTDALVRPRLCRQQRSYTNSLA